MKDFWKLWVGAVVEKSVVSACLEAHWDLATTCNWPLLVFLRSGLMQSRLPQL